MAFKAVFPTDPRDFVTLGGWEVDQAGTVLIYATSVVYPTAPPLKGYVRGTLDIGGWVITPITGVEYGVAAAGGLGPKGVPPPSPGALCCKVSYLFRTSIGGNIPKMIVKAVTSAQSALPATVAKYLAKRRGLKKAWVLGEPDGSVKNTPVAGEEGNAAASSDAAATTTASSSAVEGEGADTSSDVGAAANDGADGAAEEAAGADVEGGGQTSIASAREEEGEDSSLAAAASPSPTALPLVDLSGVWKLDRPRSDSIQPMLSSMGIGLLLRKMADSLEIVTTITHPVDPVEQAPGVVEGEQPPSTPPAPLPTSTTAIAVEDASRFGKATTTMTLDWAWHEVKGMDGKKVTYRAALLAGVDGVPVDSTPDVVVGAYRAAGGPPHRLASHPRFGVGSGALLSEVVLPDGLGTTRDERFLEAPGSMRLTTVYLRGGVVKNRLVRYLKREGAPPPSLLLPPHPGVVAAVVSPPAAVVRAALPVRAVSTAVAAAAAPTAAGGGDDEVEDGDGGGDDETESSMLLPKSKPTVTTSAAAPSSPASSSPWPSSSSSSTTAATSAAARGVTAAVSATTIPSPARGAATALSATAPTVGATTPISPAPAPAAAASSPASPAPTRTAPPPSSPSPSPSPLVPSIPFPPPAMRAAVTHKYTAALWQPDSEAARVGCGVCHAPFTGGNRIHHCRACGLGVCDAHSRARIPLDRHGLSPAEMAAAGLQPGVPLRVCDTCAAPIVTSVTPVGTAGGRVVVRGANLGTVVGHTGSSSSGGAGGGPTTVTARILLPSSSAAAGGRGSSGRGSGGGVPITSLSVSTPYTALSFTAPPGATALTVVLTVGGQERSLVVARLPPSLDSVAEAVDTDGGCCVVRGANLGDAAAVARGDVVVTTASGVSCPVERVVVPHTALQVRFPPGCGGADANALLLTVGGRAPEEALPFAYAPPQVWSARMAVEGRRGGASAGAAATAGGDAAADEVVAYLYGCNFGDVGGGGGADGVTVSIHGVPCPGVTVVLPHAKLRVPLSRAAVAAHNLTGGGGGGGGRQGLTPGDVIVFVGGQRSGGGN